MKDMWETIHSGEYRSKEWMAEDFWNIDVGDLKVGGLSMLNLRMGIGGWSLKYKQQLQKLWPVNVNLTSPILNSMGHTLLSLLHKYIMIALLSVEFQLLMGPLASPLEITSGYKAVVEWYWQGISLCKQYW